MIRPRDVVKASITRFVPGAVLAAGIFLGVFAGNELAGLSPRGLLLLSTIVVGLALGNVATLLAVRTRLRDDAGVVGSRSIIVGALAGALALGFAVALPRLGVPFRVVQALEYGIPPAMGFISGVFATVLMFFPWIGRGRGTAAERDADIAKVR